MTNSFDMFRLTHQLNRLAQESIQANDHLFKQHVGLSIREIRLLRLVDDGDGVTFVDLQRLSSLERSLTSRLIQRLIKQNLIERENDPADARRFRLKTTQDGAARRIQADALSDDLERLLLAPLIASEQETLRQLLIRLNEWVGNPQYQANLAAYVTDTP